MSILPDNGKEHIEATSAHMYNQSSLHPFIANESESNSFP